MSRIGRRPLPLPSGVSAIVDGSQVTVKGPKGELQRRVHPELTVRVEGGQLIVERPSDEAKHKALVPRLKPLLDNLITRAGFWVSPQLYERVLQAGGESP